MSAPLWALNPRFPALLCPVCGAALKAGEGRLACKNGHAYDIARQGYVNLAPGKGAFYTGALFESRRAVFARGFYKELAARVDQLARRFIRRENPVLLDAGCGEGYYTGAVLPGAPCAKIGLDLSREAVRMASSAYPGALFAVADLTRIPLPAHSVDCVLDILTPADYGEFSRVLRRSGVVIKAVPGEGYLRQLRALKGVAARADASAADYFTGRMRLLGRERVTYTLPVTPEEAALFFGMTPLTSHMDAALVDLSAVKEMTIDMELLAGAKQ